ncbi:MAG: hypothetical protein ACI8TQ_002929 [Planctomycetota bacterium]|jgi:hypothetical protein
MRFTLPLIVLALGLTACSDSPSSHDFSSDVEECKANLQAIYGGLTVYQHERGGLPEKGGVPFFVALISSGQWENDAAHARILTCPGVSPDEIAIKGKAPETWYTDISKVDGNWSSYAARDIEKFPLEVFPGPGTEAIVACDNHHGLNHAEATNVLMADGSILSLELGTEIELGNLPEGTTNIVIGAKSLLPELQTLTLD